MDYDATKTFEVDGDVITYSIEFDNPKDLIRYKSKESATLKRKVTK